MSQRRISEKAGYANVRTIPKGPNGRGLCRECSVEVPVGRRTFCSDTCVGKWRIKTDPAFVRMAVLARDGGKCAVCGFETIKAQRVFSAASRWLSRVTLSSHALDWLLEHWRIKSRWRSWWDADHIVSVVEGGGECGLEGYRTLCVGCHREVTSALRKRISRSGRMLQNQGSLL